MSMGTLRMLGDDIVAAERDAKRAQGFWEKRAARKRVVQARKTARRAARAFRTTGGR